MIRRFYKEIRSSYYDLLVLTARKPIYAAVFIILLMAGLCSYLLLFCRGGGPGGFTGSFR